MISFSIHTTTQVVIVILQPSRERLAFLLPLLKLCVVLKDVNHELGSVQQTLIDVRLASSATEGVGHTSMI